MFILLLLYLISKKYFLMNLLIYFGIAFLTLNPLVRNLLYLLYFSFNFMSFYQYIELNNQANQT